MKKDNLVHGRTTVYNINYHIVWSVKYRRKIITPEVESYMKEVIQNIAESKGFKVDEFAAGNGDHADAVGAYNILRLYLQKENITITLPYDRLCSPQKVAV